MSTEPIATASGPEPNCQRAEALTPAASTLTIALTWCRRSWGGWYLCTGSPYQVANCACAASYSVHESHSLR